MDAMRCPIAMARQSHHKSSEKTITRKESTSSSEELGIKKSVVETMKAWMGKNREGGEGH